MNRRAIPFALAVVAVGLGLPPAGGQFYPNYYNPYTGSYGWRGAYYNPWTGVGAYGRQTQRPRMPLSLDFLISPSYWCCSR